MRRSALGPRLVRRKNDLPKHVGLCLDFRKPPSYDVGHADHANERAVPHHGEIVRSMPNHARNDLLPHRAIRGCGQLPEALDGRAPRHLDE